MIAEQALSERDWQTLREAGEQDFIRAWRRLTGETPSILLAREEMIAILAEVIEKPEGPAIAAADPASVRLPRG